MKIETEIKCPTETGAVVFDNVEDFSLFVSKRLGRVVTQREYFLRAMLRGVLLIKEGANPDLLEFNIRKLLEEK